MFRVRIPGLGRMAEGRHWKWRSRRSRDAVTSEARRHKGTTHAKLTGIGIPAELKTRRVPVRLRGFAPERTVAQSADALGLNPMSPTPGMRVRISPVRPSLPTRPSGEASGFYPENWRVRLLPWAPET